MPPLCVSDSPIEAAGVGPVRYCMDDRKPETITGLLMVQCNDWPQELNQSSNCGAQGKIHDGEQSGLR
jgi:hypothetical protein